jgi:hypothetical protein
VEGLRKTHSQDSRCPIWDSNRVPPKYKPRALPHQNAQSESFKSTLTLRITMQIFSFWHLLVDYLNYKKILRHFSRNPDKVFIKNSVSWYFYQHTTSSVVKWLFLKIHMLPRGQQKFAETSELLSISSTQTMTSTAYAYFPRLLEPTVATDVTVWTGLAPTRSCQLSKWRHSHNTRHYYFLFIWNNATVKQIYM